MTHDTKTDTKEFPSSFFVSHCLYLVIFFSSPSEQTKIQRKYRSYFCSTRCSDDDDDDDHSSFVIVVLYSHSLSSLLTYFQSKAK